MLTEKTKALMGIATKSNDSKAFIESKKKVEKIRDLFQTEIIGGIQNVMDDNKEALANYGASRMFTGYLEALDFACQDVENQLKNIISEYDFISEQEPNLNQGNLL